VNLIDRRGILYYTGKQRRPKGKETMKILLALATAFAALSGQMDPTDTVNVDRSVEIRGGATLNGSSDKVQVVKETVIVVQVPRHQKTWKCTGWQESNWGGQVKLCGWE
jgi:hypothetical protein